jgi:hypothetical protein
MPSEHLLLVYLQSHADENIRKRLTLTSTRPSGRSVLWVCEAPPASVSAVLAEFLAAGVVISAALVPAAIPDERLWVAREWYGAFVVDRELVGLLGDMSGTWADDSHFDAAEFHALILRPARPARSVDPEPERAAAPRHVETAREYAASIIDDRPVVASTTLAAVREALGDWFGELADPRLGGAYALLALSGVRSTSTNIRVGNPAALRLKVRDSDVSLPGHVRSGRLTVRGYGYSRNNADSVAALHPESADRMMLAALGERTDYGVLLTIEVNEDPEVEIDEGSIFEQVSVNDVQTLATVTPHRMTVGPGTFAPLALPVWCLNSSLKAPAGQQVRPTPLALITPGQSQKGVWAERNGVLTGDAR